MGMQNRLRYSNTFKIMLVIIMNVSPLIRVFQQVPDERKYQIQTKLELNFLCEKICQIEGEFALLS